MSDVYNKLLYTVNTLGLSFIDGLLCPYSGVYRLLIGHLALHPLNVHGTVLR